MVIDKSTCGVPTVFSRTKQDRRQFRFLGFFAVLAGKKAPFRYARNPNCHNNIIELVKVKHVVY